MHVVVLDTLQKEKLRPCRLMSPCAAALRPFPDLMTSMPQPAPRFSLADRVVQSLGFLLTVAILLLRLRRILGPVVCRTEIRQFQSRYTRFPRQKNTRIVSMPVHSQR